MSDSENTPIQNFLDQLRQVKKDSNGYIAQCPAHNDKNPSLSIREGHDGRVLFHCLAGCSYTKVLKAMDMKSSELYVQKGPKIEDVYTYEEAESDDQYEIVRLTPKGFYARRKVKGKYVKGHEGKKLKPFRYQEINKAIKNNKTIVIVEGEKDCEKVVAQLKFTATTLAFGLKWQDHYAEYFEGARVVILPDNDKPGIEKAQIVAHKLKDIVKSLRVVTLPDVPEKGDVSDWIEQGGTRAKLLALIKATPLWEPDPEVKYTDIEQGINEIVAELNTRYATIMIKGKYIVIEPDSHDPSLNCASIEFISTSALEKKYAHRKVIVGYKGETPIERNIVSVWLEHPDRRDFDCIVFDPGKNHGSRYFNIWKGFAVQPRPGKIGLFLNHIFEVIADGDIKVYDHIIAIMADAVQLRPRPGVAIAILGEEGVGKGIVVNNFGQLFGGHYIHITQGSHLTGRFNRHLAEGLIVFIDEALWAGDKSAEGVLKGMITEDRLMIEPKGCDAYAVKNHNRIFMASNNAWIVPAGMEARRFFVVRASSKHIQDRTYFSRIQNQMDNGGREGLLHYLQNYNLEGIDLTDFPRTEELGNQKLLTMDAFERFWYSVLQDGKLFNDKSDLDNNAKFSKRSWGDGMIATDLFFQVFIESLKNQPLKWHSGESGFGIAIKKMVPNRLKKKIKGEMCYIFPSLQECRDQFDKSTKQQWEWEEILEDDDN